MGRSDRGTIADLAAPAAIVLTVAAVGVLLPGALMRWYLPKDAVLGLAALVATSARPRGRLPRWAAVLIGVGALLLLVEALAGPTPVPQIWGRWPRYEGLVGVPVYVLALWLGSRLLGPGASTMAMRVWRGAVAVLAVAVAVLAIAESLGFRPIPGDASRPGSLLGNATDQGLVGVAAFAVLALPTLRSIRPPRVVRAVDRRGRTHREPLARPPLALLVLETGGAAAALAAVALSASRAAVAAAVVLIVVIVAVEALWMRRDRRTTVVTVASGGVALAVLAAAVIALPLARSRVTGASPLSSATVDDRLQGWRVTLDLIAVRPLGWGPSAFVDAFGRAAGRDWYSVVGTGPVLDSPHDVVLQAAVGGGIAGAVLLVAAGVVVVIAALRARRALGPEWSPRADAITSGLAAGLALAAALLTHVTTPGVGILGGVLVGSAIAGPVRATAVRVVDRVLPVVIGAWLVVVVTATAAEYELGRGVDAALAGRTSEAQSRFDAAQALRPWDGDVAQNAAEALTGAVDAGDRAAAPQAIAWARRSLSATPDSLSSIMALAVAQSDSGDLDGTATTLESAVDRHPHEPELLARLGLVRIAQGDASGGRRLVEDAADIAPGDAFVADALARARR